MPPSSPPELSVIVPSYNRCELLRRCLEALQGQTADPESFEVIVADDGSSDGTAEMVAAFESSFRLRRLDLENGGQPSALNAGIEAAEGAACLFLDDDTIASPELVAAHLTAQQDEGRTLGIGSLTQAVPPGADPYAVAFARRWNERTESLADPDWADCYSGNLSAPREALLEVGGFDASLPAVFDLEAAFRLCAAGCVPRYLPEAHAIHDDDKPGAKIIPAEVRFGAWCADFTAAHPETGRRLLGWFSATTAREVALRRALLALRVPPARLAGAGRLLPGRVRSTWLDFVSRFAFWSGVRSKMDRGRWRQTTGGVPVLMYHAFTTTGERDRFVLPAASFATQLRLLRRLRYRVITLEELAALLRAGEPLPRRTVVLTIDDGYRDNFEIAQPILERHGFSATVYLVSGRLGGNNDWGDPGALAGRPMLERGQIEAMRGGGTRFGGHTRNHPRLPELEDAEVSAEIGGCREDLERALGQEIESFAYPYGLFDERAVKAAEAAGYGAACTTETRPARHWDDPFRIPRIEVEGSDSTLRFLRRLLLPGE
jgi:glycosyltransferase involved in cell wall biosynthesis/peptidoglycan/xylan/chitin deacetylase (PgdA/CDA1 family)